MPTILIVDDDAIDRELATRCLKPIEGLTVLYARDGREALDAMGRQVPDLVLTDLRMPGMDGLEFVGGISEEHPSVPVILMTSKGNEQLAVRALQTGAAAYVLKHSLKDDLVDTVHQVLEIAAAGLHGPHRGRLQRHDPRQSRGELGPARSKRGGLLRADPGAPVPEPLRGPPRPPHGQGVRRPDRLRHSG